jgi:coenzyme PQQ synthesis protein D (PqqD)
VPEPAESAQSTMTGRSFRARRADLAWRQAGDEVVVLDLATSSYHALNASGAMLWKRLDDWTTAEELTAVLVRGFGLPLASAARDVASFLDGCAHAGLVETRAGCGG